MVDVLTVIGLVKHKVSAATGITNSNRGTLATNTNAATCLLGVLLNNDSARQALGFIECCSMHILL